MPDAVPSKVAGVPTEPIILGFVVAASVAFLGAILPLETWFPQVKGRWVGGMWAVVAVILSVAAAMTRGFVRTVLAGVAIGAWVVAFLNALNWTPKV